MSWWSRQPLPVGGDAFVLTGGAARGAVQVGMLRALFEAGITPSVIAGTSVGSLNGAWFAAHPTAPALDELADVWLRMHETGVFRATRRDMIAGLLHRTYFVPTEGLHSVIAQLQLDDIETTAIPLRVVTTRLDDGSAVVHRTGPLGPALAASCAIPGVFQPVTLDGALHVDGGVSALAPVFAVADLAPSRIFLLDATGPVATKTARTAVDMVRTAFSHSIRAQMAAARSMPGVVTISVSDEVYGDRDSRDFTASGYLIEAGHAAASAVMADLMPLSTSDRPRGWPWWERQRTSRLLTGSAVAAGNGSA
jgi:NTE family protein